MYHYLQGKLVEKNPMSVVLDVQGVGYDVHTPLSTFSALPPLGSEVRLLTHFTVREDAHILHGFLTEEERELFRLLISVSGIGPRVAITALSGLPAADLKEAIASGDISVLTGISGIGKKTAERLIVELKEKMVLDRRTVKTGASPVSSAERALEDSLQALMSLGYRKADARSAVEKVLKDSPERSRSVEELIRAALRYV